MITTIVKHELNLQLGEHSISAIITDNGLVIVQDAENICGSRYNQIQIANEHIDEFIQGLLDLKKVTDMQSQATGDGWTKKKSEGCEIYTHPLIKEGRGIVLNSYGYYFNGQKYATLQEAKIAALS